MVTDYSATVLAAYRFTQPSTQLQNAAFCNVTVSYTHPIMEAWLPTAENWNRRLQAVGGGGWAAGRFFLSYKAMEGALADGYATLTTDAGLASSRDPAPWALVSPGNVNLYNLQNLGSAPLNEINNVIPPKSTEEYYKAVAGNTADGIQVGDFFRHFEVPGLGHCYGGLSGPPTGLFAQLRDWVENGTAPEQSSVVLNGTGGNRILCPYPRVARFDPTCGDALVERCWSCVGDSHGVKSPWIEL